MPAASRLNRSAATKPTAFVPFRLRQHLRCFALNIQWNITLTAGRLRAQTKARLRPTASIWCESTLAIATCRQARPGLSGRCAHANEVQSKPKPDAKRRPSHRGRNAMYQQALDKVSKQVLIRDRYDNFIGGKWVAP